jgi:hypothetical protein
MQHSHRLSLQVYAFDVRHAEAPPVMAYSCCRPNLAALEAAAAKDEREGPLGVPWHLNTLHAPASVALRRSANEHIFNSAWHAALAQYDKLLAAEPWLAQGYAYRAIILLKRGWRGDALAALRDADTCVAFSPGWPKAYETRVRCLKDLGQVRAPRREPCAVLAWLLFAAVLSCARFKRGIQACRVTSRCTGVAWRKPDRIHLLWWCSISAPWRSCSSSCTSSPASAAPRRCSA